MADISDYSYSKWWEAMYQRTIHTDPVNNHYGNFDYQGLVTPIVVESNREVSTTMLRHQDGVNNYKMGGVSPQAVARMGNPNAAAVGAAPGGIAGGISGCTARTGNPQKCTGAFLGQQKLGASHTFQSLGH